VGNAINLWSTKHIVLGSKKDCNKASQNADPPKSVENANFLMNSVDFRSKGKSYTCKRKPVITPQYLVIISISIDLRTTTKAYAANQTESINKTL
jgi:hypothetical protein